MSSRPIDAIRLDIRKATDRLFIEPEHTTETVRRLVALHEELLSTEGRD